MNCEQPLAIQLKTVYLSASETFVYRHLQRMQRWRTHVFAEHVERLDQFPVDAVSRLPRSPLAQRAGWATLRRVLRDETLRGAFKANAELLRVAQGASLLHAHFGEAGIAALPVQRRTGLPLITSFHGRDVAKPSARPYGRLLYRRLFRRGAAFVVVSERMREQLVQLGAPPERVHLIRTGVDLQEIPFSPRAWPDDGNVRLLTCGRLVEKKGTRYAIEALARLRGRYPHLQLTVIGEGPLRPALERQAQACGVADQVHFLGVQPVERVIEEMLASHIFVLPCVTAADGDQEGVPVVLMEAQATGMPVISSQHAGVPEVVQHGITGYLAQERNIEQLGALLATLIDNPAQWPEFGAAGRQRIVAVFDVNHAAAGLEALYDMVGFEQHRPETQCHE